MFRDLTRKNKAATREECIRLLERWRICRQPEKWREKAVHTMDECQQALASLVKSPAQVLLQLVISSAQGLCLMAVLEHSFVLH